MISQENASKQSRREEDEEWVKQAAGLSCNASMVKDRIIWSVPAGEELNIFFCLKNTTSEERSIAINLEVPKRKGKYWRITLGTELL